MTDFLTVLKAKGDIRLVKVYRNGPDADPDPYGNAKNVNFTRSACDSFAGMVEVLRRLEGQSQCCVIQGDPLAEKPVEIMRRLTHIRPTEHHWLPFDIDGFDPGFDARTDPRKAAQLWVEQNLPEQFQGVSYYVHLSSGAHRSVKFKGHVWFWLDKPLSNTVAYAWAKGYKRTGKMIDPVVYRTVQPIYTADAVFEGCDDPLAGKRSWVEEGFMDTVLGFEPSFSKDDLELLNTTGKWDFKDPGEKPGVIGAFCRAFTIDDLIHDMLSDEFEFVNERRVTWLGSSSGAKEGCYVTDDRLHFGNTSGGSPQGDKTVNAFDMFRLYKFGHLDVDDSDWIGESDRPSFRAAVAAARLLPEVIAELGDEEEEAVAAPDVLLEWHSRLEQAESREALLELAEEAKNCDALGLSDKRLLADLWNKLFAKQGGGKDKNAALVRFGVKRDRDAVVHNEKAPEWAAPWVYVNESDQFFNLSTREWLSIRGFRSNYDRELPPNPETGQFPNSAEMALNLWRLQCVSHVGYMPLMGPVYEIEGQTWANMYRPESVPATPMFLDEAGERAVRLVEEHVAKLLPNERERRILLSFLAHNVQFPGKKIRWAIYLNGVPGDGKSFFLELLGCVMGGENVTSLSASLLADKFNSWAIEKAVLGVEEMKQHGANRFEIMNKLKEVISNNVISVRRMNTDVFSAPNITNYLFFSNYMDGAPVDDSDRRYCFLRSAVTTEEAKAMSDAGYFDNLYGAVHNCAGALRKWLLEYQIDPEVKADGRAPGTDAKDMVVELSKSDVEVAFDAVMESPREGITADVLSSSRLSTAMRERVNGETPQTTALNNILNKKGYEFFGRLKWNGDAHRIFVRKNQKNSWTNEKIREILDSTKIDDFG